MGEQMMDEIRMNAQLRHPNIVLYMGACELPELALVTEFMARGSLTSILADARHEKFVLTWMRKLHFALDAANGMNFLHHQPIPVLHCDLKSQNLLVGSLWEVKVADFGLSMAAYALQEKVGSVRWMGPEVLRGERYDTKSDVFSYGIVMYEIASEHLPYHDQPTLDTKTVLNGTRPYMPSAVAPAYKSLALRCVDDMSERRPDFSEIITTLDNHMKEEMTGVLDRRKRARAAQGFLVHIGKSAPIILLERDGQAIDAALRKRTITVQEEGIIVDTVSATKEVQDLDERITIPHYALTVVGRCMTSAVGDDELYALTLEWGQPGKRSLATGLRLNAIVVALEKEAQADSLCDLLTDCLSAES